MSQDLTAIITVNGEVRQVACPMATTLLTVLREQLGLTGSKRGCNQGVCGACTVIIEGRPARSCLTLAADCDGRSVTSVEGLATGGELTAVQNAFLKSGAVQCGFCTSGILITAHAFLRELNAPPSVEAVQNALSGNLCRCSGYKKIIEAVCQAMAGEKE
jgi:carbon-monoxide dehydrogenase small subunit